MGDWSATKAHQRLIAALPYVLRRQPDARLQIVGAGPYEPELHELARTLGVAARVEIGPIPPEDRRGVAAVVAGASLVTLLSDYETHPIAALEAISLGRPVLVTHSSGLAELADRGLARSVPLDARPETVGRAIVEQLRDPLVPARASRSG